VLEGNRSGPVLRVGPGETPYPDTMNRAAVEEIAAIAAAVELVWPRPAPEPPARQRARATPAWRFSGRWWSKPPQLRRDRPWAEP
ncbi:MAG TPA: hypothetical protein VF005_04905, partial [Acidimicrobiales bacterium]